MSGTRTLLIVLADGFTGQRAQMAQALTRAQMESALGQPLMAVTRATRPNGDGTSGSRERPEGATSNAPSGEHAYHFSKLISFQCSRFLDDGHRPEEITFDAPPSSTDGEHHVFLHLLQEAHRHEQ